MQVLVNKKMNYADFLPIKKTKTNTYNEKFLELLVLCKFKYI